MPRRIVILTQKEIGDLIVVTPLVRALKKNFPTHLLTIVSRPIAREVYAGNPYVDSHLDVSLSEVKSGSILKRVRFFFRYLFLIRKLRPDILLQLESNDVLALWSFFSGAKIRVSTQNQTFRRLFTAINPLIEGDQSARDFYLSFLEPLGVQSDGVATELFAHRGNILNRKHKTILIHPGARIREKLWPIEYWVELLPKLARRYSQIDFQIVDSIFDTEICGAIGRQLPKLKNLRWVRVADFAALCNAVRQAKLAIVMDSSPRHVAAAYDVPTLAILPEWTLNDWGIYDPKRHRVVLSKTMRPVHGLETISVAAVERAFASAVRLLR